MTTTTSASFPLDEYKCAAYLLKREQEDSVGGVLYVKDDHWAYVMPSPDIFPARVCDSLKDAMDDDRGLHYFIIIEADGALNVVKFPKVSAAQAVLRGEASSSTHT